MVALLGSLLADAAPAIVTSLGVNAAKGFGSQVGSGAGKAASDALFSSSQNQQNGSPQQQQNQGLFGAVGGGIGGLVDGVISLPGKVAGGVLNTAGNVLSGAGNLLSGNQQQVPSSAAQQRFIAMQSMNRQ